MGISSKSPLGKRLLAKGLVKPEDFEAKRGLAPIRPFEKTRCPQQTSGTGSAHRSEATSTVPVPEFASLPSSHRKWRNIPTHDSQGVLHPSKLQARVTDRLRCAALAVIPEVSMPLSERPRDRIRIDALVILRVLPDGEFIGKFVEVKGVDLGEGKQKRRRFEDRYGIQIEVIRK